MEDLVIGVPYAQASASFWRDRRVFLTGHTGFKGGWLSLWLAQLGAEVCGYALAPPTTPNFFTVSGVDKQMRDIRGDIRDGVSLNAAMESFAPEVVFHLAAQPLVGASHLDPIATYETNVMGTARLLEAVRTTRSVKAVVCVTTDKCYQNREWNQAYRESDPLGGDDPYSSSKACAELVAAAFRNSYFSGPERRVALATARAGNVIGGGDWATDRLIPDLLRSLLAAVPAHIRNPDAIRPWQHVLEPLHGYLLLAEHLLSDDGAVYAKAYNFGPADEGAQTVAWVATHFCERWGASAAWTLQRPHGRTQADLRETGTLKLDASRACAELAWQPRLQLDEAFDWVVRWYQAHARGDDMQAFSLDQIAQYEAQRNRESTQLDRIVR